MSVGSFESLVSSVFVEKVRADALALRKEANQAHRLSPEIRKDSFDITAFGLKVFSLGNAVAKIFRRAVPKVAMATGEVMRHRSNLNILCDDLIRVANATRLFETNSKEARFLIAAVSEEFNKVFRGLDLELEIQIHFVDDEIAAALPINVRELSQLEREHTEMTFNAMRHHVIDIEAALSEAHEKLPQ
jgi:hypothetical protein